MTSQKPKKDEDPMPAGRKDRGSSSEGPGSVEGLAGVGGSSGAGGVRAKPDKPGDLSGINQRADEQPPPPGTTGRTPGGARQGQQNDGGLPGKTRGEDSETVPNQDSEK